MPINKDGTDITAVRHRTAAGAETVVTQVIHMNAGGTQTAVFGAQVSIPDIKTPSAITYNSVTVSVQNTYDALVTLYVTVNGVTKNASATANGAIGDTPSFNFTGLSSNVLYPITAYGALAGHANSQNDTLNFTTTTTYTATPTISIINTQWNSITWRITNTDSVSALITSALFASNGSTQIGTTKTATIAAGATVDFSQSGLSASTNYYINRKAAATDGKLESNYVQSGPHATVAQPVLATPSIIVSTRTGTSIAWYVRNLDATTVQIGSNIDSTASWPYYDTSVGPTGGASQYSDTWTKTGLGVGTTHTIYAQAIDPTGSYASSGITEVTTSTLNSATTPTLSHIGSTTSTLTFRLRNNDTSSATYTWFLGDWSKSGTGSVGASPATSDFVVTGLASSTSYTIYAYVSVSGESDSSSTSSSGTTNAVVTYLPSVAGLNFTVQGNNLIRVTYTTNPYYVTLEYDVNGDWNFRHLTCTAPSGGQNFTVSAGQIRVRAINRSSACGGNSSTDWSYSSTKLVGGVPI